MKTQCSVCKAKFNAPDQSVGKKAKCPKCGQAFTIEPFVETPAAVPAKIAEPVKAANKPAIPAAGEPAKEIPESKKLSKTVYVYCWAAAQIIAGIFGMIGLMLALRKAADSTLIETFAAADVFLVCSLAIELMLFYKMWAAIQDDDASASPAKAVGFLFIPVFNIYWILCMITGFAEDYNAFIRRRTVTAKDLPLPLFLIYAVMFLLSTAVVLTPLLCIFAFVGRINRAFISSPGIAWTLFGFALIVGIGHFVSYILAATKTCDAVNALPASKS